jgi:hypothetical protein
MGKGFAKFVYSKIKCVAQELGLLRKRAMESSLDKVIAAIVSRVVKEGTSVTKTKLLKLLYLFDVEYYRTHRSTFTGFNWKFYLLGPWAAEYDQVLNRLVATGILNETTSSNPDYDTHFFKAARHVDIDGLFSDRQAEKALRIVLNAWADKSTGEILDYVYFKTEPMEHGVRNEPLDFSHIPEEQPQIYRRTSSDKTPKEVAVLRNKIKERLATLDSKKQSFEFTPPNYDEEFYAAMAKLETME